MAVSLVFAVGAAAAIGVVVAQLPRLARLPLTVSSASYTFPLVTLGVSLIRMIARGTDGVQQHELTTAEVVLCWTITVVTALPTFFAIFSFVTLAIRGMLLMPIQRDSAKAALFATEDSPKVACCTLEEHLAALSSAQR
jgi:tellurite resistance protein TehA-like permease